MVANLLKLIITQSKSGVEIHSACLSQIFNLFCRKTLKTNAFSDIIKLLLNTKGDNLLSKPKSINSLMAYMRNNKKNTNKWKFAKEKTKKHGLFPWLQGLSLL